MSSMPRTTKQAQQTAAGCYAERFAECQDLLKRIVHRLEEHKQAQEREPANWGHAGDLGHVNEELAYVLASLGDRSAVDAKGLAC